MNYMCLLKHPLDSEGTTVQTVTSSVTCLLHPIPRQAQNLAQNKENCNLGKAQDVHALSHPLKNIVRNLKTSYMPELLTCI